MTMAETVEDAFCISDELASRMESTAIKTVIIDVDKNDIPLNVYGSEEEYKFFPDIGENIREDGIICALRQAHDSTVVSDMSELALAIPQYSHDNITYAESSGAVVLDIDIWWNPSKKVKTPPHIFSQVEKYREGHKFYCARVVETYIKECVKAHREAAPEFISLVDRCESFNAAYTNSMQTPTNGNPVQANAKATTRGIANGSSYPRLVNNFWNNTDVTNTSQSLMIDLPYLPFTSALYALFSR
jgi:hypothetical protein